MSQRTRRATEAVDTHAAYLEAQTDGSMVSRIERGMLDPTADPNDLRYKQSESVYDKWGGTFTKMMAHMVNNAMTFAVTTDLMTELVLTMEMMEEEGIDWLPMLPHMVPTDTGLILFPFGIENTFFHHGGLQNISRRGHKMTSDEGGGDRWFVDGFMWSMTDRVARDSMGEDLSEGISIWPLTRWRGRDDDRPFRLQRHFHPDSPMPEIVASNHSAWAFDETDELEWVSGTHILEQDKAAMVSMPEQTREDQVIAADMERNRMWLRSIVWTSFRWLTDEIWVDEYADRASARRMKRARPVIHENPPQEDGQMVIVDLRAERKEYIRLHGEGEPPWWRTRWTVRGHWAKRRYAIRDAAGKTVGPWQGPDSVEGETFYYKKVYIEPFAKGPEWAPLVLKDRVGVLAR